MTKERTIWKSIRISVESEKEIKQISEKVGKHLGTIQHIYVSVIPTSAIKTPIREVGELSLSFNNNKEHTVHVYSEYCPGTPSNTFSPLVIQQVLNENQRITGYYRDLGSLKNEFREFINYQLQILLECIIKEPS